ncbi:polyketide cyclase / dehydrase and lipid transport [Tomitella fengzijianii]|uniref:Polyketide cyclase / dehydrase and lipid transport n=1 Tax=Tomitella fengzijianii TaxID=2597660 RepID=A0A516X8A9_9ACTN|nr:polyketide cyclase / dehydrase and lipid transport [Tomitella fengzijianii]
MCDAQSVTGIQVADQGFIAAPAHDAAVSVRNARSWRRWWPDLQLQVREDRGDKGVRWTVAGPLEGTMEVWLEPALDGVVLHYFLHAEAMRPSAPAGGLAAENRRRRVAGRRMMFEIKSILEAGRAAGEPPGHRTAR